METRLGIVVALIDGAAVVDNIDIEMDDAGTPVGSGGVLAVFEPFTPLDDDLNPTRFVYRLPPAEEGDA